MSDDLSGGRRLSRRVAAILGGAVLVLAVGFFIGARSPWGVKAPHVAHGVAMRANDTNDLVMFDADDGFQASFGADHIWWEDDGVGGDARPPCLRHPGRKANVEVGYVRVAGPDGGSRSQVVWMKCL